MDPVANVTAQDLIEVASPDQGSASGYITGKESLAQIGNFIANGISYAGLPTTDQRLVGAITELNADRATLSESITDAYDNTATYEVGDFCIYNNTLYKCNTAIATPEDFDSTKWTQTTIMAEAGGGGGAVFTPLTVNIARTTMVWNNSYTLNGYAFLDFCFTKSSQTNSKSVIGDWDDLPKAANVAGGRKVGLTAHEVSGTSNARIYDVAGYNGTDAASLVAGNENLPAGTWQISGSYKMA